MKKRLLLVLIWMPTTFLSLISSLLLLNSYGHVQDGGQLFAAQAREMLPRNGYQAFAALPEVLGSFTTAIEKQDARPEILRQFLHRNESPLESHADAIVSISDQEAIDFRLITAIAMCESNAGKKMPEGSYNAWGYKIYTGQNSGAEFQGWEHAIQVMARYLATKYYSRGLTTPEEIGPIYAPPSVNTGNSWAKCVRSFMNELI